MNTKTAHTSTPWHIGLRPGPYVYGPLGEEIADCRGLILEDEDEGTPENKENAAFIVKAVNLHSEMFAMLQHLVSLDDDDTDNLESLKESARELIAKASTRRINI